MCSAGNNKPRGSSWPLLLLLLITAALPSVSTDSGVLVRSKYGQSLTSSTLHWISVDRDSSVTTVLPENVIEGGQEGTLTTYVCRTYHSGISLLGSSDGMSCTIVFYDAIYSYGRFDVLVNPSGAGRLVWVSWDRSKPVPLGSVENGGHYVARRKDNENVYVGRLNPNELRGKLYVAQAAVMREFTDGELLVEVEPVSYEVSSFVANDAKQRIIASTAATLAETILANLESDKDSVVSMALPVAVNRSVYLRNIPGVDKAIPVTLTLPEAPLETVRIFWSQNSILHETSVEEIAYRLPLSYAVNVTVTGVRTTIEAPYTARLRTTYADGKFSERPIDGISQRTFVKETKTIYGEPYFLTDKSALPTTAKPNPTIPPYRLAMKENSGKGKFIDTEHQLDEPRDDSLTATSTQQISIAKDIKSTEAALTHGNSAAILASINLLPTLLLFTASLRIF